jgi:hydrogenase expression/formation protein HypE
MKAHLPVGKLPVDLLAKWLSRVPASDPRLVLGPGVGLDCAVIDYGETLLALKTDPITFATDQIGWYAVQVNSNDIATTGARPRWFMTTVLLPENLTTADMVEEILSQVFQACEAIGVSVIGGHTEITYGIDRPILVATMIGEVERDRLVTPRGAAPGDRLLLSKGVPIEATAILARELPERLMGILDEIEFKQAASFLYKPGISVLREARLATTVGRVSAMHDPTEGGLAMALWELAEASQRTLRVDLKAVPVPELSGRICRALGIDPMASIASGALLLAAPAKEATKIRHAWEAEGITCAEIGGVEAGLPVVWDISEGKEVRLTRPERDEIARLF